MMRRASLSLLLASCVALSCSGTTGYELVTFYAAARGPSGATKGKPYSFATGGHQVTLTKAVLHVGALYLVESCPTSGAGAEPCTLPATYVGEVRGGGDVDMLDPSLQELHVTGNGTTIPACTGQVWLMHGDVNAASDPLPILTLQGTIDGAQTFSASIPIDESDQPAPTSSALPGENPICQLRIVTPIPVSITLAQGGTLVLALDPKALFVNANLDELTSPPGCPTDLCFTRNGNDQPSVNLFLNLRSSGALYRFEWQEGPP
jgi:hypothetical protein